MMRVSPTTKVSTFKKRFREEFGVGIKCHKGNSLGHIADDDDQLFKICTKQEHERDFRIDLQDDMAVGDAEAAIAASLGFKVQLILPDGKNASNKMSVSALRQLFEGGSAVETPEASQASDGKETKKTGKAGCILGMILAPFL